MQRLKIVIFFALMSVATDVFAQQAGNVAEAERLMGQYRFEEAIVVLENALSNETDSLARISIEEKILSCKNGAALTGFVSTPEVIAKKDFHISEFLLYLPLQDESWRIGSNGLVQAQRDDFPSALYYPQEEWDIFFTDKDENGIWNIYSTERINDTLWSYPHLLNEAMTSLGNELYPMLSPDGKNLYFASDGLYGVGGYDLYVSRLDEQTGEWGTPENLGFPYSSPANDILFAVSSDEKYYMLVSDREAPKDSVTVFILTYEPLPIKKNISDPALLSALASLEISPAGQDDGSAEDIESIPPGIDTDEYSEILKTIRALKDSITIQAMNLNGLRSVYAELSVDTERKSMEGEIAAAETAMERYTDSLDKENRALQKIEMDFLMNGVIIDPDKAFKGDKAGQGKNGGEKFVFTEHRPGGEFEIMVNKPEKKFDYSFQILPTGQFAEDNRLPDGLVYQIQIFASSSPAGVKHLKGLSPVFERNPSAGKYIYSVGLFRSYGDALSNLNKVKSVGFKSAFITAFLNGNKISAAKGREIERSGNLTEYSVSILSSTGTLDETASAIIRNKTAKDILRTSDENGTKYIVGPFKSRDEAESLAGELIAAGVEGVSVDEQSDK